LRPTPIRAWGVEKNRRIFDLVRVENPNLEKTRRIFDYDPTEAKIAGSGKPAEFSIVT
jgi:hypothetical protein